MDLSNSFVSRGGAACWFVGCLSFSPLTHVDWSGWREPADTFHPLRSSFLLFLFFLLFFASYPRRVFPSLCYFHSFHAPPAIQKVVAAVPSCSKPSIEARDIDVLNEIAGIGCLWIGSFAYRPGLWFLVTCLTSEPRVEMFACEVWTVGLIVYSCKL